MRLEVAKKIVGQAEIFESMGGKPSDPRLILANRVITQSEEAKATLAQTAEEKRNLKMFLNEAGYQSLAHAVKEFCGRAELCCAEFVEPGECRLKKSSALQKTIIEGYCDSAFIHRYGIMTRNGFRHQ